MHQWKSSPQWFPSLKQFVCDSLHGETKGLAVCGVFAFLTLAYYLTSSKAPSRCCCEICQSSSADASCANQAFTGGMCEFQVWMPWYVDIWTTHGHVKSNVWYYLHGSNAACRSRQKLLCFLQQRLPSACWLCRCRIWSWLVLWLLSGQKDSRRCSAFASSFCWTSILMASAASRASWPKSSQNTVNDFTNSSMEHVPKLNKPT